jgi:hypothetical protein
MKDKELNSLEDFFNNREDLESFVEKIKIFRDPVKIIKCEKCLEEYKILRIVYYLEKYIEEKGIL